MEPVSSSLAGACFALLLTFRSANMLNTTTTATTMLSRVWRLELSQGAATRFRIVRAPKPEKTPALLVAAYRILSLPPSRGQVLGADLNRSE